MPVCKSPRYTVKVFDRERGEFLVFHVCYTSATCPTCTRS